MSVNDMTAAALVLGDTLFTSLLFLQFVAQGSSVLSPLVACC